MKNRVAILAMAMASALTARTAWALLDCGDVPQLSELVAQSTRIAIVRIKAFTWDRSRLPAVGVISETDPAEGLAGGPVIVEALVSEVLKGPKMRTIRFRATHNSPNINNCVFPYFMNDREAIVFLRGTSGDDLELFGGVSGLDYLSDDPGTRRDLVRVVVDEIRVQHGPG